MNSWMLKLNALNDTPMIRVIFMFSTYKAFIGCNMIMLIVDTTSDSHWINDFIMPTHSLFANLILLDKVLAPSYMPDTTFPSPPRGAVADQGSVWNVLPEILDEIWSEHIEKKFSKRCSTRMNILKSLYISIFYPLLLMQRNFLDEKFPLQFQCEMKQQNFKFHTVKVQLLRLLKLSFPISVFLREFTFEFFNPFIDCQILAINISYISNVADIVRAFSVQ